MTKPQKGLGVRAAQRFARCPRCQELIDAASMSCRYCGVPVTAEELEQSAAMQEKLIQAKSRANDRSSMVYAIKVLIATVILFGLWLLLRIWSAWPK